MAEIDELVVKAVRSDTLFGVLDYVVDELVKLGYPLPKLTVEIQNRAMQRRLKRKKAN